MEGYTVKYLGNGEFNVTMGDGSIKICGDNLIGMIKYTYFDDNTLPEVGWEVSNKKLLEDYFPKMQQDVLSGNLKPN